MSWVRGPLPALNAGIAQLAERRYINEFLRILSLFYNTPVQGLQRQAVFAA